jgi:hypothetical protein
VLGPSQPCHGHVADQLQTVPEGVHLGREQVPVGVERDARGGMPELRLGRLDARPKRAGKALQVLSQVLGSAAEDGSARSTVEVVAEELGPSLRWATATPVRATSSASNSTS